MNKKFMFNFILLLTCVALAVLWLLSIVFEQNEILQNFNIMWVAVVLSFVAGTLFTLRGLFSKEPIPIKKFNIFLGAGLFILCLLAFINTFDFDNKLVLPIIAIIGTAALLLSFIAVGGKKWDTGDNQKAGYKNYYQRKAEEEERNKNKDDN